MARFGGVMTDITNATPFGVDVLATFDKDDNELLLVCAQGRFVIPSPGEAPRQAPGNGAPALGPEQSKPSFEDVHWDDPATSSLRFEGQSAYRRPATDVYLSGHACTPGGKPASAVAIELRLGSLLQKRVLAIGERRWIEHEGKLVASAPKPFVSLPLRYENAFGGRLGGGQSANEGAVRDARAGAGTGEGAVRGAPAGASAREGAGPGARPSADPGAKEIAEACQRNPVGCGAYTSAQAALGQPLPQLENPAHRIRSFTDRPAPAGLGPIARHWTPRLGYAGTYDDAWSKQRAPLWPKDFDERFLQAAAAGMTIAEPAGGELVTVSGVSSEGTLRFILPAVRLEAECYSQRGNQSARLVLDGIHIDADERVLTLVWRASISSPFGAYSWDECSVRLAS